jgi:phage terminase Nu1 subunit (DNA packaging protein)
VKVNRRQLSEIIGITERQLVNWALEGMPVEKRAEKKGQSNVYDTVKVIKWLRERDTKEKPVDDFGKSKARLTAAQADKVELERDELQGALVRRELVVERLSDLFTGVRQRLLAIPRSLGSRVDPDTRGVIKDEIIDSLSQIADWIESGNRRDLTKHRELSAAPTGTNGKSVGRKKSSGKSASKRTTRKVAK